MGFPNRKRWWRQQEIGSGHGGGGHGHRPLRSPTLTGYSFFIIIKYFSLYDYLMSKVVQHDISMSDATRYQFG